MEYNKCEQCFWEKIEEYDIPNPYGLGTIGKILVFRCKKCRRLLKMKL